ncbi:MAG: hypothetical protein J0H93_06410 [Chlamydiales bacterium]|nr:hypothetical protein [Chlamydiales bacterium]
MSVTVNISPNYTPHHHHHHHVHKRHCSRDVRVIQKPFFIKPFFRFHSCDRNTSGPRLFVGHTTPMHWKSMLAIIGGVVATALGIGLAALGIATLNPAAIVFGALFIGGGVTSLAWGAQHAAKYYDKQARLGQI